MKIMLGGGFDEDNPETEQSKNIKVFGAALAKATIEQGHSIVCGNLTAFDRLVIEAGCDALDDKESDSPRVRSWRPKDAPTFTNRGAVYNSRLNDWGTVGPKLRYPEPIWEADAIILVGGWKGTRTAATWGHISKRLILPVASFGLAAEEIYEDSREATCAKYGSQITEAQFSVLNTAVGDLSDDQVAKLANDVVSLAERMVLPRDVFVVMSYAEDRDLENAYRAFKEACEKHNFIAKRLDREERGETFQITDEIVKSIRSSAFCIVDLTNNRPNVYYELGYAQAVGRPVVLTMKKGTKLEFDVQGLNTIVWDDFVSARDQVELAVAKIAERFGA